MTDRSTGALPGESGVLSEPPFGIEARHGSIGGFARWRMPLATFIFVVVLGSALLGWLGGGGERTVRSETPQASVTVEHEPILRSGNWFESVVTVRPRQNVGDLVISVSDSLWRGMSIDTLVPDAESAESIDGRYSYHFGPVRSDEVFTLKLDGQIQPRALRRLTGKIVVADGEVPLASVPLTLTVLP